MAVRELADMTWEEARDLDRGRGVAILPVGAIEAHGPHLPLDADVVIAAAMAKAGAERLASRGLTAVILPALPYTAAGFGAAFAGTLSIAPDTLTALVLDLARELTRAQFAALALANAHLDPAHLGSLAAAIARAREERLLPVVHADLTRKPWASRLGEEFKTGACHAGRYETSIVLAADPMRVREEIRVTLPPNPSSLSTAIRAGARTFEEAGGPRAYFGWPADATAREGQETIGVLGDILAEVVWEALTPERTT